MVLATWSCPKHKMQQEIARFGVYWILLPIFSHMMRHDSLSFDDEKSCLFPFPSQDVSEQNGAASI
jgi:hypothetical protein